MAACYDKVFLRSLPGLRAVMPPGIAPQGNRAIGYFCLAAWFSRVWRTVRGRRPAEGISRRSGTLPPPVPS